MIGCGVFNYWNYILKAPKIWMILIQIVLICASFGNFVTAAFSKFAEYEVDHIPPNCSPEVVQERLIKMIDYNEPTAFHIIISSECGKFIDPNNFNFLVVFDHLLNISQHRNNSHIFFRIMFRANYYSIFMWYHWERNTTLLPLKVLKLFKKHFHDPIGTIIYAKSLKYEKISKERSFLNNWLVEIQDRTLNWPFMRKSNFDAAERENDVLSPSEAKSLKSKSEKSAA